MNHVRHPARWPHILAVVIGAVGAINLGGGVWLATLGGSLFYAAAGLAMLATAVLLWRRRAVALHVFTALVLGTVVWAWAEIGADWWPLVPRGDLIFIFGALLVLPWTVRRLVPGTGWRRAAGRWRVR